MFIHYRERHSKAELAKWSINKDVLDLQDPPDRQLPDEFIQRMLKQA